MSNFVYRGGRQALLEGKVNWLADSVKAVLLDTTKYTASVNHATLLDIPVAARISTSGTLTNRAATNGVATAGPAVFTGVPAATVQAVVVIKSTGTDTTSRLLCYVDTAVGLPVAFSTGGNGTLNWTNQTVFTI